MIINTGMRTDIPAFYHEWLINRIKEGFVLVRNPYNPSQVTRYSLSPEVVDLIAFGNTRLARRVSQATLFFYLLYNSCKKSVRII